MGNVIGVQPLRKHSPGVPLCCEDGISWLRCRITGEEKEPQVELTSSCCCFVLFVSDPQYCSLEEDSSAFTVTSIPDGSCPPHPVCHKL